jgi:hypothetical protein
MRRARRLNGWQRLWFAIAVLSFVSALGIIWSGWETGEAWIRDLEPAAPTRVHIDGVGDFDFPATMSPEAIDLVTRAGKGSAEALNAGIRAWDAEFRRVLDTYAMALDRLLVIRILGFWAAGVLLLYLVGWLAGWVWRGFRTGTP